MKYAVQILGIMFLSVCVGAFSGWVLHHFDMPEFSRGVFVGTIQVIAYFSLLDILTS